MKKGRRNTYTGILGCHAWCEDCPWAQESSNALGSAARHADAHPDHEVQVEQVLGVTYNRKGPGEEVSERRGRCVYEQEHEPHERQIRQGGETVTVQCSGKGPANR